MILRIILFKLFNKESTWELLVSKMGDIKLCNFDFNKCKMVLEEAILNNIKIYNDAYIGSRLNIANLLLNKGFLS